MRQIQVRQGRTMAAVHSQAMDRERLFFAVGTAILLATLLGLGLERLLIP